MYNHKKSQKHITNKELYETINITKQDILKQKDEEIKTLKIKYHKVKKQKKAIEQEKEAIEQEKEVIQKVNQELEKEKIELKTKVNIYKEFAEKPKSVNNTVNNNNNLNYVNTNFKNAPALKKINDFVVDGLDLNSKTDLDKITNSIVYYYSNKCLHKFIGDHVISKYKKEDKSQQSFHTTDVARKKYLVKLDEEFRYLYDENYSEDSTDDEIKSRWVNDSNGVKITYLLFNPIIRKLLDQMTACCSLYSERIKQNEELLPREIEKFTTLNGIVTDIDKKKLTSDINKYIAPHFELNKK
jgi:hypothetical protein